MAVVAVTSFYIRGLRWRVMLRHVADVPREAAFSATAIGFGVSTILPFRLGEIARPAVLSHRVGIGLGPTLSSVVLERVFDMVYVIICFLILSAIYPLGEDYRRAATGLGALAALGLVVLALALWQRARAEALVDALLGRMPGGLAGRLGPLLRGLLDGLGVLRDPGALVSVIWYSTLVWAANAVVFLFAFAALDMDVPRLAAALACIVIVAFFVFLPQAPGFVGTWQAGCVVALNLFSVPEDAAVGFSLLTWLLQTVINLTVGGVCLAREKLTLRELLQTAPTEAPAGAKG